MDRLPSGAWPLSKLAKNDLFSGEVRSRRGPSSTVKPLRYIVIIVCLSEGSFSLENPSMIRIWCSLENVIKSTTRPYPWARWRGTKDCKTRSTSTIITSIDYCKQIEVIMILNTVYPPSLIETSRKKLLTFFILFSLINLNSENKKLQ